MRSTSFRRGVRGMAVEVVCVCSLDCERHTELVELCQAQQVACAELCQVAVPAGIHVQRVAPFCPLLLALPRTRHPLLQAGCWPSACCCVVLQDDAGPGLEEPASSLQLAQLRLQEQLDARACARLCWLQMEGPYRLCRLGPYTNGSFFSRSHSHPPR